MKCEEYNFGFMDSDFRRLKRHKILEELDLEILKLLVKRLNYEQVSRKLNIEVSYIKERVPNIYKLVEPYMSIGWQKRWFIYKYTFPNGKVYVGKTTDIRNRWRANNYKKNTKMYEDIQKYGWENVKKEILMYNLDNKQASEKEKEFIIQHESNYEEKGYNNFLYWEQLVGLK